MKQSIKQAYDIAHAFITDKDTTVGKTVNNYSTTYHMTRDNVRLEIYAPHGAPVWSIADEFWMDRNGSIYLSIDNKTKMDAHTRYNVGRAMIRPRHNPISLLTRMRAPAFFHLLDLAEKRHMGKLEPTDNTVKIHLYISRHMHDNFR